MEPGSLPASGSERANAPATYFPEVSAGTSRGCVVRRLLAAGSDRAGPPGVSGPLAPAAAPAPGAARASAPAAASRVGRAGTWRSFCAFGTDAQKERHVPALTSGKYVAGAF